MLPAFRGCGKKNDQLLADLKAERIRMENGFQDGLQIAPDHFLGAAITNRWNSKRPLADAPAFGIIRLQGL
jgi:hypothetical protein